MTQTVQTGREVAIPLHAYGQILEGVNISAFVSDQQIPQLSLTSDRKLPVSARLLGRGLTLKEGELTPVPFGQEVLLSLGRGRSVIFSPIGLDKNKRHLRLLVKREEGALTH